MKSWRDSQSLITAPAAVVVVVGGVIFYFPFYFNFVFGDRFFIKVLSADFYCFKFLIVEESHTFHIKKKKKKLLRYI